MKLPATLAFCLLAVILCGSEPIPWSREMNCADRWQPNSSGTMTIVWNPAENAVAFQAKQEKPGDFWVYPTFALRPGKSLAGVERMSFEIRARQKDPEAGYKLSAIQFQPGGRLLRFAAPPADGSWQKVELDLTGANINPAKVKAIQVGFNPKSPELSYELKDIRLYGKSGEKETVDVVDAIDFTAPGAAYRRGEPVTFRMKPQFRDIPSSYRVEEWSGREVAAGKFPEDGRGTLDLSGLSRGYYRLSLSSEKMPFTGKRNFAILPDLAGRKKNPDMTYCIDSCLSWHGRRNAMAWQTRDKELNWRAPGPNFDLGIELCDRLGVALVRERIAPDVARTPDQYDFGYYLDNAGNYAKRGIGVLDMYSGLPKWCKTRPGKPFADDALEICDFARKFSAGMRGKVEYWEFCNEQDISGMYCPKTTGAGIWDYIAMLKAAAYGHKEGAPEVKLINGGLAFLPIRPAVGVYFRNDYQLYGDAFNVHTYRHLSGYPEMVAQIREFLKAQGAPDMPVWFSEFGTHSEGSGEVDCYLSGLKEHSEDQELIVAEFIPKANILLQQSGVDKSFLFLLPGYNEGGGVKPWGQLRFDFTVKPGFVALAVQIEQLGDAKLLGEMKMPEGVRAFLFRQPDGSQSVILWSVSPVETDDRRGIKPTPAFEKEVVFPASGKVTVTEMLGAQKTLLPENGGLRVTSTRFPLYLAGLSGLKADLPAIPVKPFPGMDGEKYEKGIIMNLVFPEACKISYMGDSISIPGDRTDAVLQVWNLTGREQKGVIEGRGCAFGGVPAGEVALAPKSLREFPVKIDCGTAADGEIAFSGRFNGRKTSRLAVPFRQLHRLEEAIRQEPVAWTTDPKLWSGPYVKHTAFDGKENAIALDIAFPPGTHPWTYPEYRLQLPQESLKGAYGLSFEMKSSADIKMCLFITPMETPGRPGNYAEQNLEPPRKDAWEKKVVVFSQNPGEITALRFGMTPESATPAFRLMIRNVKALYRD